MITCDSKISLNMSYKTVLSETVKVSATQFTVGGNQIVLKARQKQTMKQQLDKRQSILILSPIFSTLKVGYY